MTDRYAVIGNPVAHSMSPQIHAMFARETGTDIIYERLLAPRDGFAATVQSFRVSGGIAANVTLPFKLEAFALAQSHSARAQRCCAVNTLKFIGDEIHGDITDGVGLVRDIEHNLGVAIGGRRVLLLGAGGAARGVVADILSARPASLSIANRTAARATEIAETFRDLGTINAIAIEALSTQPFDIIINATSAGLNDALPPIHAACFANGALAYDMVYGRDTPFLALARLAGARAADGLGMLVEQAAESFYLWRGVRPATAPVIAQLQDERRDS